MGKLKKPKLIPLGLPSHFKKEITGMHVSQLVKCALI